MFALVEASMVNRRALDNPASARRSTWCTKTPDRFLGAFDEYTKGKTAA